MKVKALSDFRVTMFADFKAMQEQGAVFYISHRRHIYRLSVEDTGEMLKTPYKITKPRPGIINPLKISTKECPDCQSLLVNGICMNKQCPSNQKSPG